MSTVTTPRPSADPAAYEPLARRAPAVHDFWTIAGRSVRGVFREPEFFIPALIAQVAVALNGCGVPVRSLTLRTPTLDDVYLHVTGTHFAGDEQSEPADSQQQEHAS